VSADVGWVFGGVNGIPLLVMNYELALMKGYMIERGWLRLKNVTIP
jgi:hypothetical protein